MGSFRSWRTVLIAFAAILAMTVAIGGCFGGGDSLGAVLKVCVTEIDTENLDRFGADLTPQHQVWKALTLLSSEPVRWQPQMAVGSLLSEMYLPELTM